MLSDAWFLLPAAKRRDLIQLVGFLDHLDRSLEQADSRGGIKVVDEQLSSALGIIRAVTNPEIKLPKNSPWAKFRDVCQRHAIPAGPLVDYSDGLQAMRVRRSFRDFTQFDQHVRQVVLGPGHLMRRILMGEAPPRPGPGAMQVARAWATVTWMTRLAEDLHSGRLYIPLSELGDLDLSPGRLTEQKTRDGLLEVAVRLLREQDAHLKNAEQGFQLIEDRWARRWAVFQLELQRRRAALFLKDPSGCFAQPERLKVGWREQVRLLARR